MSYNNNKQSAQSIDHIIACLINTECVELEIFTGRKYLTFSPSAFMVKFLTKTFKKLSFVSNYYIEPSLWQSLPHGDNLKIITWVMQG